MPAGLLGYGFIRGPRGQPPPLSPDPPQEPASTFDLCTPEDKPPTPIDLRTPEAATPEDLRTPEERPTTAHDDLPRRFPH